MTAGTIGPRCSCCRGKRSVVLPGDILVCPDCDGTPPNATVVSGSET